ncbi:DUF7003 family protein [Acaryochloris marina]|uniref:Uncharacterized protein n=1 Tax=Acaryochloris marina (strain MBIC 11017) TaxID=329726 RepID=B0CG16_ACAM1|nr:hypothetical protein [Acaryochloris marina]ABW29463.1 hypothetical protein AM1_4486 [Acaryochloris marina MBIC11017]BDM78378.1 hypothetical protein AM10699_12480 [Acaryochloris marina MBIC10699]
MTELTELAEQAIAKIKASLLTLPPNMQDAVAAQILGDFENVQDDAKAKIVPEYFEDEVRRIQSYESSKSAFLKELSSALPEYSLQKKSRGFTADEILQYLDKSDYPLLTLNVDIAAVRVTGFCNQESWAIVYELLMNYPSSDGIGLMLRAYGPGVKVAQGFDTPVLHSPFEWYKWEIEYDESHTPIIPQELEVYIRNDLVEIPSKDVVRQNRAPEFDFDLLVHLVESYGEELYSTDEELSLYVSKDLEKLVHLDDWHHKYNFLKGEEEGVWKEDKLHIPSYTLGVEVIARILETQYFDLCDLPSVRQLGFEWTTYE